MNSYQKDQLDDFIIVTGYIETLSAEEKNKLTLDIEEYLLFREQVDGFLSVNFSAECTKKCYQDRLSACCSKDSIITFFADFAVNVLLSDTSDIHVLMELLKQPNDGYKCVYLGGDGCMWKVKPIVCALFLCDRAQEKVFEEKTGLKETWKTLRLSAKKFRWPDRPVLFDRLEQYFIAAGFESRSMYLHNSPGLLNVKKRAGLLD